MLTLGSTFVYIGAVFLLCAVLAAIAEHRDKQDRRRRRDAQRRRQIELNRLSHLRRDWWMT